MKKDVSVTCPCCHAVLLVDVDTGKILSQRTKEEQKMKRGDLFDKRLEDIARKRAQGTDVFDDAHSRAAEKRKALDDAFEDARRKAEEEGPSEPGVGPGPVW